MRPGLALAWLLMLGGCPPSDGKGNGIESADTGTGGTTPEDTGTVDTEPPDPDGDGDGFPLSQDCNDDDPAINPDAVEACDGVDNDCDDGVDDEFAASIADVGFAALDDAMAVAGGQDTVSICPGDWPVTSIARNDNVTLVGVSGRDLTTIRETAQGTVLVASEQATFSITGLTVDGSLADGIIVMDEATLEMTDSRVSNHVGGSGIVADGEVFVTLTGTDVEDNDNTGGDGGGLFAQFGATITLTDCNVTGNAATNGGGIYAAATFVPNTITLTGTTISLNTADQGAGVVAKQSSVVGDGASTISDNVAAADGGGLALYDAPLSGVLVATNQADRGGGVAALHDAALNGAPLASDLASVVLDQNTASQGAGIYVANGSAGNSNVLTIDAYSSVTLNAATTAGGGAHLLGVNADLESNGADWGTDGLNDNTPDDVNTTLGASTYDGPATFTCNGLTGCS